MTAQKSNMKAAFLSALFALCFLAGAPTFAGESLKSRLQKHTLDAVEPPKENLAEQLADLAKRYKAKYGDELPVYVSAELLGKVDAEKPKPVPKIPGLDEPREPGSGDTRTGLTLSNVPLIELFKYYSTLSNTAFTVRADVVLFHKVKKPR